MIGSLYWDPIDNRVTWRQERLKEEKFDVLVPIRYGRLSSSRGNTYTMVFSQLCERKNYGLGSAKVITCKNKATNIEDIIEEAKLLWAAERNQQKTNGKFWASWGSIGLLCNPNSRFSDNFFAVWSSITKNAHDYGNINHTKSEKPVLTKSGFLNISWPIIKNKDESLPLDIVLATATNPTIGTNNGRYPKAKIIAEAWKNDNQGNDNYFWENIRHGICTFQDETIANLLNEKIV